MTPGTADAAVAAVEELCRTGCTDAPVYDIALNSRTGHRVLDLGDSAYFVAEGIFAQEIVGECRRRGLLADAFCVTQHPAVTFVRRLTRDLREHRKPPFVLVRRGLHLLLAQRALVAHAEKLGCRNSPPTRRTARSELAGLTGGPPRAGHANVTNVREKRSVDPARHCRFGYARLPRRSPAQRSSAYPGLITSLIIRSRCSKCANADFIALTVNHCRSGRP